MPERLGTMDTLKKQDRRSFPWQPAAVSIGIGEATLFRWLKNPQFKANYRKARHQVVSKSIGHLQTKITKAIDTLLGLTEDKEAPSSARVAAAKAIIDQSLRAVETGEIEARIERIESRLKEEKSK